MGLPGPAERDAHRAGFRHALGVLSAQAAADELDAAAVAAVEGFLAAWNEDDAQRREELLRGCFDARRRVPGRDGQRGRARELAAQIAGARAAMSGTRLTLAGPVLHSHAHVGYDCRIEGPDGSVLGSGTSTGRLGLDGRLREVAGFWR